jgi:hypothetical protein
MAHFAKIEDGVVREVLVIGDADCTDANGVETDEAGQAFIHACGLTGEWKRTSINANIRGKFAGIGDIYDAANDVFVARAPVDEN